MGFTHKKSAFLVILIRLFYTSYANWSPPKINTNSSRVKVLQRSTRLHFLQNFANHQSKHTVINDTQSNNILKTLNYDCWPLITQISTTLFNLVRVYRFVNYYLLKSYNNDPQKTDTYYIVCAKTERSSEKGWHLAKCRHNFAHCIHFSHFLVTL